MYNPMNYKKKEQKRAKTRKQQKAEKRPRKWPKSTKKGPENSPKRPRKRPKGKRIKAAKRPKRTKPQKKGWAHQPRKETAYPRLWQNAKHKSLGGSPQMQKTKVKNDTIRYQNPVPKKSTTRIR